MTDIDREEELARALFVAYHRHEEGGTDEAILLADWERWGEEDGTLRRNVPQRSNSVWFAMARAAPEPLQRRVEALERENKGLRLIINKSCAACEQPECQHCRYLGYRVGLMDGALYGEKPPNQQWAEAELARVEALERVAKAAKEFRRLNLPFLDVSAFAYRAWRRLRDAVDALDGAARGEEETDG